MLSFVNKNRRGFSATPVVMFLRLPTRYRRWYSQRPPSRSGYCLPTTNYFLLFIGFSDWHLNRFLRLRLRLANFTHNVAIAGGRQDGVW